MFDKKFSHYLTYGATDQHTIIELASAFDGLVVPATVAAFQRDGTGGFILALSATQASPAYAIDPRFPLFQQKLDAPKKSHSMLAELLGAADLIRNRDPEPEDFSDDRIRNLAKHWIDFNLGYVGVNDKFDKYAQRLNEEIVPDNVKLPQFVLAPYFMASGSDDPWWERSDKFYNVTREILDGRAECIRTVAGKDPTSFSELIDTIEEERFAIWVNDLHELRSSAISLEKYGRAIQSSVAAGSQPFALYGGFFSVLLGNMGLAGSCHGIGFSEHRSWVELPRSGPAPPRYYQPVLHRYISQEDAHELWEIEPDIFSCECRECNNDSPLKLEYHALMKHSVHCRNIEIERWASAGKTEILKRLSAELDSFVQAIENSRLSVRDKDRFLRLKEHIPVWLEALKPLG